MKTHVYKIMPDGGLRYKPEAKPGPARLDSINVVYSDGMEMPTKHASLLTAGWLVVEGLAMVLALVRSRIAGRRRK